MITAKRKPASCPLCGGHKIASILYGMPPGDPDFFKDLESTNIVLGGCVITGNDPTWQCVDCGAEIYSE